MDSKNTTDTLNNHIAHHFDSELSQLHHLTLKMMHLVMNQWEQAIESLEDGNLDLALEVIGELGEVLSYEGRIDQAILTLLAKESPVAKDLRMVLALSKISVELKYLGEEVNEIAKLILALYEPKNGAPHAQMIVDMTRIIEDIRNVIANLAIVLGNLESKQARLLLQYDYVCEKDVQKGVNHQLMYIHANQRQIRSGLTTLQIMKSLESSSDHCKNLAEYCILMIDGEDVRHQPVLQ